jgi:hypothetical protein
MNSLKSKEPELIMQIKNIPGNSGFCNPYAGLAFQAGGFPARLRHAGWEPVSPPEIFSPSNLLC